jgi:hypothetical protein
MLFPAGKCVAQEDNVSVTEDTIYFQPGTDKIETIEFNTKNTFVPNPRRALLYAAVCPGLGQIYNRKYWKLPIVYGAFTGLVYGIVWNGKYYTDYKQAYSDFIDNNGETNSWINMLPVGSDPETVDETWFKSVLVQKKDVYRRYRDLCIIGVVGVYVLTLIDAFVDAQLFEFDISPDLTLNVEPQMQVVNRDRAIGLQCRLHF